MPILSDERHGPYDRCIYCGDTQRERSEEHSFPKGFGGREILAYATCSECRPIINEQFEQDVLKNTFGKFRYKHKIRGRRMGNRPNVLRYYKRVKPELDFDPKAELDLNDYVLSELPLDQYPSVLHLPVFRRATSLLSLPALLNEPPPVSHMWINKFDNPPPGFYETSVDYIKFGRELAKIAHCHAVGILGIDVFEPTLTDIILGKDLSRLWHYVGGRDIPPPENEVYEMELIFRVINYRIQYCVLIRFASFACAPRYEIVVGYEREH